MNPRYPTDNWDVIVLGLGGVGSAAAYHLARRGHRVLGLDPLPPAHDLGSSHGRLRVIRQAYFEHPAYVPLLRRAYDLWEELEAGCDESLFRRCGLLEVGPADGVVVPGVLRSASEHGLEIDSMTFPEAVRHWPWLSGEASWQVILERQAGALHVEACVAAHLRLATEAGACCRHGTRVESWEADGNGILVSTDNGRERSASLLVAAGPWGGQLLRHLGLPLQVLRKHQYWFASQQHPHAIDAAAPCFFFETPAGYFYGFPPDRAHGIKVSRHSGGDPIAQPDRERSGPCELDAGLVRDFTRRHVHGVSTNLISHQPCYYTMTPDEHFVIDSLPDQPNVIVTAGLSGHGFKLTSVLGEVAAGLVTGNESDFDLDLFRINRFSK